ncbi:glutaredoxin family protein [Desulfosarcina variabilis str. Montpellier]|uniref:glutaredoxin family protein n=1 Tax=Desulfosarcina variabilis TaxID=2300 RepID=UPI003AFA6A88
MTQAAEQQSPAIVLYGLQTCSHCKSARNFLAQKKVTFRTIYVDMLIGQERNDTLRELKRINPAISFPTLRVGEHVIVGFKAEAIEKALDEINQG